MCVGLCVHVRRKQNSMLHYNQSEAGTINAI
jgi:hypothetical protein